jgi:hypothetical protein
MESFRDEDDLKCTIIEKCAADRKTHGHDSGLFACVLGSTTYQIKYGVSEELAPRIATQLFLYDAAQKTNNIRVPGLLYHFDQAGRTYLVMEHIDFIEVSTSDMDNRIEDALRWLSCLRGDKLGPVGGGCIIHRFFNEGEAPLAFKSVEALELYIAKGKTRIVPSHAKTLQPVTFNGEPLMFVQANLDDGHFGVDKEGNTVIMGFRSISCLPQSFGRYTLLSSDKQFLTSLPDKLHWLGDSNMNTMVQVAANLAMTAGPALGLDEDGKPVKPVKRKVAKKARGGVESEGTL